MGGQRAFKGQGLDSSSRIEGGPIRAHFDRILRPVKLPAPGGRSDRRDHGRLPGGGGRPGPVEGGSFRGPRRRTAGVLEARDQTLPRVPGDPDAARHMIRRTKSRGSGSEGERQECENQRENQYRRRRRHRSTGYGSEGGLHRLVPNPRNRSGGYSVGFESERHRLRLLKRYHGFSIRGGVPGNPQLPRGSSRHLAWRATPSFSRSALLERAPEDLSSGPPSPFDRLGSIHFGRSLPCSVGNRGHPGRVIGTVSAPMERRSGPAGAIGARPQERRGPPRTPAEMTRLAFTSFA